MDYSTINVQLKTLRGTDGTLNDVTGATYVTSLRDAILNGKSAEKLNSIVVLAKTVDYLSPNNSTASLFDQPLFQALFNIAVHAQNEILKSVLHISTVFLVGSLFSSTSTHAFDPLLLSCYANKPFYERLAHKVSSSDLRLCDMILHFVAQIQLRMTGADGIVVQTRYLLETHFFDNVGSLTPEVRTQLGSLAAVGASSQRNLQYLEGADMGTEPFVTLAYECAKVMGRSLGEGHAKFTSYERIGLKDTEDPYEYIVEHFSAVATLDLLVMLESANMQFRKNFSEHAMFATPETYFPLMLFATTVTDLINNIDAQNHPRLAQCFAFFNSELYYSLMASSLRFWMASHAVTDDFDRVAKLVSSLLDYYEVQLTDNTLDNVIESVENLKHAELKKFQLEQIKASKDIAWSQSMSSFNQDIKQQVVNFVKSQRFIELSKGSWVHIHNPIEKRAATENASYYYVVLSSNSNSLIYKEFQRKHTRTPNIDRDGIRIDFKQITNVKSDRISETIQKGNLVNISPRLSVSRMEISVTGRKPFVFYVDSESVRYSWLDGLRMLLNQSSQLSEDTLYQINELTKIRTEIQLIDLPDSDDKSAAVKTYDPEQLSQLATQFYYD